MLIACGSLFSSGWNLFSASPLVNKFVCWSVLMYGDWLTHDTVCQCFGWLPLGGTSLYDQSPRYRVAFDPSPQQACHPCSQLKTRWLWKYFVHMAALHNETQMIFPMRKRRRNAATNEFKIIKLRNFWTGANPASSQPLPRKPDVTPDITISFQSCLSQSSPPTSLSLSKQFCQMSAANWVFFGAMHDLGHCHPAAVSRDLHDAVCTLWFLRFSISSCGHTWLQPKSMLKEGWECCHSRSESLSIDLDDDNCNSDEAGGKLDQERAKQWHAVA